ncbi:MAG TPA: response regulator [bacterium]|nr:response regulator [bacterium]
MAEVNPTVLVIEDEPPIRRFLRVSLENRNLKTLEAAGGEEGLALAASHNPDIILLDLGLPDLDGLVVLERLRQWASTPIIILSARGKEEDKVKALESGADDYLTKPIGVEELNARIKVALRHAQRAAGGPAEPVLKSGSLKVDLEKRQVFVSAKEVHLTPIQYKLLSALARQAGKLVTQSELLREIWGPSGGASSHYLRIYIHQLRHKLEENPANPQYLITETGIGYRLRVD